ncbi:amidohydrolase family protein [Pseudonocardia yunnanensis]|uniref:Amidohydrolase family protein n=1 Tax=Pseudonocardia yunnanensis TaxID=58107 RepID=A0ABW4FCD5_9PSEU
MIDSRSLTVVNALIFDGSSPDLTPGAIEIVDGTVTAVGDLTPAAGATVVDAGGKVVMPGLIDAHFHAYGTSLSALENESVSLSYVSLVGAARLRSALGRGFTTVRDVAGGDIGLANAIERGYVVAPRYLYTGAALSQTGGHGDARPADFDLCCPGGHMCEVVDGVDNLRRAVRERFRTGAHAIKVMTSGGVVSLTDPIRIPQYSPEELRAVVEEAGRRGSYVAAHAYSPESIVHAVSNGVRTVEHGNLLDEGSAGVMAEHGAYLVPTLVAYDAMERRGDEVNMSPISKVKNKEVLDSGLRAIEVARAAGVTIGWGSDLMGELEDDQLRGLRLQLEVESPLEVLRSVTSVNAEIIRRPDLGRIGVGAAGDLLLVDGNPLEDPSVVWDESRPRTVIQRGMVVM